MRTSQHVIEGNYNFAGRVALICMASGKPPYDVNKVTCRVYRDMPLEIWKQFNDKASGAPVDKFFRDHVEGKFKEQDISFETYTLAKMLGPAVLDKDLLGEDS
jgi:hypothetical protein